MAIITHRTVCRASAILAVLLVSGQTFGNIVDVDQGIALQARSTATPGNVAITWDVSTATLNTGANDFELQFYVGGGTQWQPQFSTAEPTDNNNPAVLGGVPELFCFRMVATINGTGDILGQGTSGNKPPCADPPPDSDGDGVPNASDAFPNDPNEWEDTDNDGTGNNADTDDDNDGLSDTDEINAGTNPLVSDTDGDGDLDGADNCPTVANADQQDSNGNGVGDACEAGVEAGDLLLIGSQSQAPAIRLYRYRNGGFTQLASGIQWVARGVATDSAGDVYVAGLYGLGVFRANFANNTGELLYPNLVEVMGVGLDDQLYVIEAPDASNRTVSRINPATLAITPLFTFQYSGFFAGATGITADAAGNVYVAGEGIETNGGVDAGVLKWSAASQSVSILHTRGCQNERVCAPNGIAFNAAGNLLVSDWTDDDIVIMDPNTGDVLQSISVDNADAVAGGPDNTAYVKTAGFQGAQSSFSFVDFGDGSKDPNVFSPLNLIVDIAAVRVTPVDSDGDGIPDSRDDFPSNPAEWYDTDNDGIGNNADTDDDNDGLSDVDEVTVHGTNPLDPDSDDDGVNDGTEVAIGTDPLDPDEDNDGVLNGADNCPLLANANQANFDGDSLGDVCDPDDDNDGVSDGNDQFPFDPSESADNDNDGIGNNADTDDDNDGISDTYENSNGLDPLDDSDADEDLDNDTFTNRTEFIGNSAANDDRSIPQPRLLTVYIEGEVTAIAQDMAGGPFSEGQTISTAYVLNTNPALNPDANPSPGGAQFDLAEFGALDVDGTQYPMTPAAYPIAFVIFTGSDLLDVTANLNAPSVGDRDSQRLWLRIAGAGAFTEDLLPQAMPSLEALTFTQLGVYYTGDTEPAVTLDLTAYQDIHTVAGDFDGDGINNDADRCPLLSSTNNTDTDQDGIGNPCDNDDDNDAAADADDDFPLNANEQVDTDGDGVGDNTDAFPDDPSEQIDTDGDGIGNNADADDDNDGLTDLEETGTYGTDPLRSDTDRDGLDDGQEIDLGLNPLDPNDCPQDLCPTGSILLRIIPLLDQ